MNPSDAPGQDQPDRLSRTLGRAVELATGGAARTPRPAQLTLSRMVAKAMGDQGSCAVRASTGTGKSIGYLVPAALRAADTGERTVVSTESLSLQQQIADKDAPVVVDAVREVTGRTVSVAVYKGWQNTACALAAVRRLQALSDDVDGPIPDTSDELLALARSATQVVGAQPDHTRVTVDGELVRAADVLAPAVWAATASAQAGPADRARYPQPLTDVLWGAVSVSAADCLRDKCPLRSFCRPAAAKSAAAAADIVVTNHTLLGVQAAKQVPVVLSSRGMGRFHHIVVDEAHALPDTVRKQGEAIVSGQLLVSLLRAVDRAITEWSAVGSDRLSAGEADPDEGSAGADGPTAAGGRDSRAGDDGHSDAVRGALQLRQELAGGAELAVRIDKALAAAADAAGDQVRIGDGDNPLGAVTGDLLGFLTRATEVIGDLVRPGSDDHDGARQRLKLRNRVGRLWAAVDAVTTHRVGTARWLERSGRNDPWAAKASPVQVDDALRNQVWVTEPVPPPGGDAQDPDPDPTVPEPTGMPGARKVVPLSVTLVSATLPEGFTQQVGVPGKPVVLPSPLLAAFAASAAHVPTLSAEELPWMTQAGYNGKRRLTMAEHPQWAAGRIAELVEANGGSALILSATAGNGRLYTDLLRQAARGRWQVLSQWDGMQAGAVTARWRDDITAVLVGTRSCMTGLDAPGATCTLVVLDRVPRAPQNPLGQARVELLTADGVNRWEADRRVYAADAAVLTHQAVGRLIRRETDVGMVVVLDPRLLKGKAWSYPEATRRMYAESIDDFGFRTTHHDRAVAWLRAQAAARSRKAG